MGLTDLCSTLGVLSRLPGGNLSGSLRFRWRIVCEIGVLLAHRSKDVHRLVSGVETPAIASKNSDGCRSRQNE
jgi:hypothetical protein